MADHHSSTPVDVELEIEADAEGQSPVDSHTETITASFTNNDVSKGHHNSDPSKGDDDAGVAEENGDNDVSPLAGVTSVSIWTLFRYASTEEKIAASIAVLASSAFGTALPLFSLVFGEILDDFQDEDELLDNISEGAVYFVYIAIGAFITSYLSIMLLQFVGERQAFKIRVAYFKRTLYQDIAWFDLNDPNKVTSSLAEDVSTIQRAIGSNLGNAVQHLSTFLAGLILGFVKGWELALVILAFMPLLVLSTASLRYTLLKISKILQEAYSRAGAYMTEAVSAIRTVAAFGGERIELESYRIELAEAETKGIRSGVARGANTGFMFLVMYSAYGVGLWYGARLIARDREDDPSCIDELDDCFSGGDVIQIFFSVLIGAMSIGQASPDFNSLATAQSTAMKVFSAIESEPSIRLDEGESKKHTKGKIEFENVTFEYPSRPGETVLNNISFEINSGETVALVGSSGCGKSTCVSLLQRFYDVTDGKIKLDDKDIKTICPRDLRELIGLVSQEPQVFATTVKENIAFGGLSQGHDDADVFAKVEKAAKMACAHDFIKELPDGYETDVGTKGSQLSGGQKQRIAIARAIFRDPQIVLLDEATSALDTTSEKKVQAAIDQMLSQRFGKQTTIMIAHRLSTIRNCDKIIAFEGGKIAEAGTHSELLKRPKGVYRKLYEIQGGTNISESDPDGSETPVSPTSPGTLAPQYSRQSSQEVDQKDEKNENDEPYDVPWKRVWDYQKSEKWQIICAIGFSAISGAIMPSFAILFSEMITIFFDPDTDKMKSDSAKLMAGFIGLGGLSLLSTTMQTYLFEYAGQKLTTRLRIATYEAILRQDISFFDAPENSPGRLANRLASDAYLVKSAIGERVGVLVQSQASLLTGIIIAFESSWHLALVVLAIAPLFLLSGIVEAKAFIRFSKEGDQVRSEAGQISQESLTAIRTVQSLNLQDSLVERYRNALLEPYRIGKKGAHVSGASRGGGQFVIFCSYALVFYLGALFIREDLLDFQDMMRVFFALTMGAMGAGQASAFATDISKATSARRSIFQIIDHTSCVDSMAQEEKLQNDPKTNKYNLEGKIDFRDVHFSYPARPDVDVLKGINLSISPGKTVGFCGESGSGKSTIIQLLERFYDPRHGDIQLDGVSLTEHNIANVRRHIGFVSQEPQLFSGNLAYNIAYGRMENKLPASRRESSDQDGSSESRAVDEDIVQASRDANAEQFINSFDLQYFTHAGDGGNQLSGGQKQRVAIARALIRSPKILLLDEATSALDSESESIVQATLDRLLEENHQQRTTIIVAHRLSTIRNCDLICVFDHGKIVETGTHADLIAQRGGKYRQLARAQGLDH